MPTIDTLIFDLDGTLVDSAAQIAHSVNTVLERWNLPTHRQELYVTWIGDGLPALIGRALSASGFSEVPPQIAKEIAHHYRTHAHRTPLYPTIYTLIDTLVHRHYACSVLTNKPQPIARKIISHLFPRKFFKYVRGANSRYPPKPNPKQLEALIAGHRTSATRVALIGDSPIDYLTARNAGVTFIAAAWGYGIAKIDQSCTIIKTPLQLLSLVQ